MTAAPAIREPRLADSSLVHAGGAVRPCHVPAWSVAAASVRGTSHAERGALCGDSFRHAATRSGVLIAAVADGCGSAAHGDIGSAVAVDAAVGALCDHVILTTQPLDAAGWEDVFTGALEAAAEALAGAAALRQVPVSALATTLILAVATPSVTVVVQVGDGAAVVDDRDGNLVLLNPPPRAECLNETHVLSDPDFLLLARGMLRARPPRNVCMFTDGLQMLALRFREAAPHRGFFSPLFRFLEDVAAPAKASSAIQTFLGSPAVSDRTDDDLTLLVARLEGSA